MECPLCKTTHLEITELEPGLASRTCHSCGGYLVELDRYLDWASRQTTTAPADAAISIVPAADSGPGKLCPSCGGFMIRYQVGHGVGFCVDRCRCGRIWLDRDEWAVLKAKGLHGRMHLFASEAWQGEIRDQARHESYRQTVLAALEGRLGDVINPEDLRRLKEIRQWLDGHPAKAQMFAYLAGTRDL